VLLTKKENTEVVNGITEEKTKKEKALTSAFIYSVVEELRVVLLMMI